MMEDAQLLRRYVEERSQDAFAELVRRHINVVYFAALRRVGGDSHLADDIAQSVFADLARKAPSLQDRTVLTGWLYTSTRFAAAQAVRTEQRRRTHEQEAQTMHELHAAPDPDWNQLRPIIDEAMDELSEPEREAVLLRYFENRPFVEVGARFALSADAARMRVERALDKLRGLLARRGIVSTPVALAAAFTAQSGLAAPASLTARIAAGAVSQSVTSATATVALRKILAGIGLGVLGVGVVLFGISQKKDAALASQAVPTQPSAASSSGLVALKTVEPPAQDSATSGLGSPLLSSASPPAISPFGGFSDRQKNILKTLWEHQKMSPDKPSSRWGYRPGLEAPDLVIADFEQAAGLLEAAGLVGIKARTEVVFLTDKGVEFCLQHAQEIDAYPLAPHPFRRLSPENKILFDPP